MRPLTLGQMVLYGVASMGSNMVYGFANFAFPLFLGAYGVPNVVIGLLAQERSLVGSFVQPVVGAISDRLPPNPLGRRRPFFLVGVPLTAFALIYLSTQPPLWAVVAVMTVFSFFLAVAVDPYLALMPDITPSEQRGRVGGIVALFTALGTTSAILISFVFWAEHQERAFYLVALGLAIPFAITFFTVREPRIVPRPVGKRRVRLAAGEYLSDLLARRELVKYLLATFFFWLGNGGITPFITRFVVQALGVAEDVSFLIVLPAIVGAAVFAVPAGLLTERFGKKGVLNAGMLLFGLSALVGGQVVETVPQALLLTFLVGMAIAVTNALIFPQLTDMMPRERAGEFAGIGAFVWSLAQPIGAAAAGGVADLTGTMRGAFAVGGLAMIVAFAILLTVRVPRLVEAAGDVQAAGSPG